MLVAIGIDRDAVPFEFGILACHPDHDHRPIAGLASMEMPVVGSAIASLEERVGRVAKYLFGDRILERRCRYVGITKLGEPRSELRRCRVNHRWRLTALAGQDRTQRGMRLEPQPCGECFGQMRRTDCGQSRPQRGFGGIDIVVGQDENRHGKNRPRLKAAYRRLQDGPRVRLWYLLVMLCFDPATGLVRGTAAPS